MNILEKVRALLADARDDNAEDTPDEGDEEDAQCSEK